MLSAERPPAIDRFISELRKTIDTSAQDAADLQRCLNSSTRASTEEIMEISRTISEDVKQLNSQLPQLVGLSKEMPRSVALLNAGFDELHAVDAILDQLESRLEALYGLPPVVVPDDAAPTPRLTERRAGGMEVAEASEKEATVVEDALPVTPRLEDFGISDAGLRADLADLGLASISRRADSASRSCSRTPEGLAELGVGREARGVLDGRVDIGLLGIETPVQVEDRFDSRRREAVTAMIARSSPRMTAGVERRLDYSGLADGYYGRLGEGEGKGKGEGRFERVCEMVGGLYEGLPEFVKSGVCREGIVEAAEGLVRSGEVRFDEKELREVWVGVGTREFSRVLFAMTKMKVLVLERKGVYELQV